MTDDIVAYMGWGISAQEQIDGFRREVRELKDENALLWEQGVLLFDKTLELGTENAKLRELCKAWREFAYEIIDECFGKPEANEDFMALDDRMRKLWTEGD